MRGPGRETRGRLETIFTAISGFSPQAMVRFVDFLVPFVVALLLRLTACYGGF